MPYSDLVAPAPESLYLNLLNVCWHPGMGVFLSAYYGRNGCDPKIGGLGVGMCCLYSLFSFVGCMAEHVAIFFFGLPLALTFICWILRCVVWWWSVVHMFLSLMAYTNMVKAGTGNK